jgi:septal ring factor EnvC (AmiA/AmiB activator)
MSDKLTELKNAAVEAEGNVENIKAELSALESAEEVDKEAVKGKKTSLRSAESTLKKANTAVAKEEARVEREAEREAKKAEREAKAKERKQSLLDKLVEREKAKAEREAKKAAKKAELEAKKAERESNRMPEQNGIRRPKPNTLCGRVWGLADNLSQKFGQPTPISELLESAKSEGLNEGNVKAEYARWRKFHGITGRVSLQKEETVEIPAATPAEIPAATPVE